MGRAYSSAYEAGRRRAVPRSLSSPRKQNPDAHKEAALDQEPDGEPRSATDAPAGVPINEWFEYLHGAAECWRTYLREPRRRHSHLRRREPHTSRRSNSRRNRKSWAGQMLWPVVVQGRTHGRCLGRATRLTNG